MKSCVAHCLALVLVLSRFTSEAYKPVILVHGLFGNAKGFGTLTQFIQKAHPGTKVFAIDLYNEWDSVKPLWTQVKGFSCAVESIVKQYGGAHLLCYSQGGVICRALLSVMPNHNIHTFIALSSPLAGQYGDTNYVKIFPKVLKKNVYKMCYNKVFQSCSICQYWNDPHHKSKYLKYSNFLPLINGETKHKDALVWKENFLKISKLVLIGGPDDGVITPWQSSQFGFYNGNETVVEMRKQQFFGNDVFGLKTLDFNGKLSVCTQPGVKHTRFPHNYTVFTNCIQDWLN